MSIGDGAVWNESVPDNDTIANQIDDYDRDLRVGVRSRLAREHVFPASQTATSEGGHHSFITLQAQTAAPAMAGTTGGALYVTTATSPALIFTRSNGTDVTVVNTAGQIAIAGFGSWDSTKSITTNYTATQDLIVVVYGIVAPIQSLSILSNSGTPTATRAYFYIDAGTNVTTPTIMSPVKNGDGWRVNYTGTGSVTINVIPWGN